MTKPILSHIVITPEMRRQAEQVAKLAETSHFKSLVAVSKLTAQLWVPFRDPWWEPEAKEETTPAPEERKEPPPQAFGKGDHSPLPIIEALVRK